MAAFTKLGLTGTPVEAVPAAGAVAYTLTASQGSYALTGKPVTFDFSVFAASKGFDLTGQAAALRAARGFTDNVSNQNAPYVLTGKAVAFKAARKTQMETVSLLLTGEAAILKYGHVLPDAVGSFVLSGQTALARRTMAAARSLIGSFPYILTGKDAGVIAARRLKPDPGNYDPSKLLLAGKAAALTRQRVVISAQGALTLTGKAAILSYGHAVSEAVGNYTLTGKAAGEVSTRRLTMAQGSLALTGQAAILKRAIPSAEAQGAYVLSGRAVTLTYQQATAPASGGTYTLTGEAAGSLQSRLFPAAFATYALTGQSIVLSTAVPGSQGSYVLTGKPAGEVAVRKITAIAGSYVLTGKAAAIRFAHVTPQSFGTYAFTGIEADLLKSGQGAVQLSWAALILPSVAATVSMPAGQGSYVLTGRAAVAKRTLAASFGSYSITGETVGAAAAIDLVAARGTYVLAGQSASFPVSVGFYSLIGKAIGSAPLVAGTGSYTISGRPVGQSIKVTRGAYTLNGQDASLTKALIGSTGQYVLTGKVISKKETHVISAGAGSYAISGYALGTRIAAIPPGMFVLTGEDAEFFAPARTLDAVRGFYVLNGRPAHLAFVPLHTHPTTKPRNRTGCIEGDDRGICVERDRRRRAA